jgi:hypothetical protein
MVYVLTLPKRLEVREPNPSLRHQSGVRLVGHRFPIKNGLTFREILRLYPSQAQAIEQRSQNQSLTETPINAII